MHTKHHRTCLRWSGVHKTMNQCSAEQLIQQQLPPAHTLAVKIANLLSETTGSGSRSLSMSFRDAPMQHPLWI